jgi:hypothetical protein
VDLYALPPEEFVAARAAAAKHDKALAALRKPTVSAWVVNTLVRRDSRLLDELLALGASLAEAQRTGKADTLRELGEQRHQLVQAVTDRAIELAEREVSAGARGEVEATLDAALADPASAAAVRTGQLVRPLSFAGFGGVDLDGAVAAIPKAAVPRAVAKQKRPDMTALEAAALEAAGALDDAVRAADTAARALTEVEARTAEAQADEDRATTAVAEARAALDAAEIERVAAHQRRTRSEKEAEALERKVIAATRRVASAQQTADQKRQELDAARRA